MGKMTIRRPLPVLPLTLAVALFMENMDATVIATSLPAIAGDLGTEPIALKLALTAYYVALAIFIPLSGWMADRFGTRVSDALRVHAAALRTRRRLLAEETAGKLPVKLLLPLVLCIFPGLLVVLMGPPAIRAVRVLVPILAASGS